jgi:hypothetical protein
MTYATTPTLKNTRAAELEVLKDSTDLITVLQPRLLARDHARLSRIVEETTRLDDRPHVSHRLKGENLTVQL